MSNKATNEIEELWEKAADTERYDRVEVHKELFQALDGAGRAIDAIQVGWEWLRLADDGLATLSLYECAFRLSHRLTFSQRHEESSDLIEKVLAYPDFDGVDFERGLLHWNQSSNHEKQNDICRQLSELHAAISYLKEYPATEGTVRIEAGLVQIKLKLYEDANVMLSNAIALLEDSGEPEEVARAKRALAETLFEQGQLQKGMRVINDSLYLFEFLESKSDALECLLLEARFASRLGSTEAIEKFKALISSSGNPRERVVAAKAHYYFAEHLLRIGELAEAQLMWRKAEPILRAVGQVALADLIQKVHTAHQLFE